MIKQKIANVDLSNLIIEFKFFQLKKIDKTRKLWGQTFNIVIPVEGNLRVIKQTTPRATP